ncbi:MAG: anthranilate phosphoribosyltransferase, partial [Calditrichaeota bacterium]
MIQEALKTVVERVDLSREQAYRLMHGIMSGEATPAQIAAFLVACKMKGETSEEVAGFAAAMRDKATPVQTRHRNAIDMCGTGGDGAGTFNISTVASFVVAAAGVPVAKHGNRSVSSRCGSADLLEALGVNIDQEAEQTSRCLNEIGFGFLYAPRLHKAMKYAVAPRREIRLRTVFNMLGPLTNPARVTRQLLGVYDFAIAPLMAEVLHELGSEHVLIVHSEDGLDEVSIHATTRAIELRDGEIRERTLSPKDFGLNLKPRDGILGGSPEENAETAKRVLNGEPGIARDFVVANAACGLVVGGATDDFGEAARMAMHALDSGAALAKLRALKEM